MCIVPDALKKNNKRGKKEYVLVVVEEEKKKKRFWFNHRDAEWIEFFSLFFFLQNQRGVNVGGGIISRRYGGHTKSEWKENGGVHRLASQVNEGMAVKLMEDLHERSTDLIQVKGRRRMKKRLHLYYVDTR